MAGFIVSLGKPEVMDVGLRDASKRPNIITLYILFTREQRERGTGIRESEMAAFPRESV